MRGRRGLIGSFAFAFACAWLGLGCDAPANHDDRHDAGERGDGGHVRATGPDCASCHTPEYRSARHHVGERPTTCAICHTQMAWEPSRLEHPWPLTGKHDPKKCFSCHEGTPPKFEGTPTECVGCHRADYDHAPGHAGKFPTTCETCHTPAGWKPPLPHEWHDPTPKPVPTTEPETPPATSASTATKTPGKSPKPKPKPVPKPKPTPTQDVPDITTGPSSRSR